MDRQLGIREIDSLLASTDDALRATDSSAFTVLPRVLRRVIRHELDLPGLLARIPHRESYVVAVEKLRQVVSPDELSHDPGRPLPEQVILLSRPEEEELASLTRNDLLRRYWRLLFHARIHLALDQRVASGQLIAANVRQRIDQLGQVVFDEIEAVLRQENMLLPNSGRKHSYQEFVALYWELRYFQPARVSVYFPSLRDFERLDALLLEDVDARSLYEATRLAGVTDQDADHASDAPKPETISAGPVNEEHTVFRRVLSAKARLAMLRRAERAGQRGNQVRSAITRWRAARSASSEMAEELRKSADDELNQLAGRLAAALDHDAARQGAWRDMLRSLLPGSAVGFWNPNAKLLYDLQKVCLAHERETYVVDLISWVRTFGRRPLRRALPNQREVLISRHLRTAAGRLKHADLSPADREALRQLLHESMLAAETRVRDRLRPVIEQTLWNVELKPDNAAEGIAAKKIVEELLDGIVQRGFLNMGDLRDAVSRSTLKLSDLSGPGEVWRGDALLRADRVLSQTLDGVYQRGAFYLRWLQRLSSMAFGTEFGRALVLYAILPFGGAFVIIKTVEHVVYGHAPPTALAEEEAVAVHATLRDALLQAGWVICVGVLLLGLLHVPWFRGAVVGLIRIVGRMLRRVFVEIPRQLMDLAIVREVMRSLPVTMFRRHLLNPLLLTVCFCWVLPALGWYRYPSRSLFLAVWMVIVALLNSRAGRDIEEVAAERLERMWHRIRIHFFVALFDLIMDTFKWILELVERVLYSVDEWLRFKSGESDLMLGAKAALGVVWVAATFVIRFCVTLLIEPQVNPIKHFPVVTVSHKVLLPFTVHLAKLLEPLMGPATAGTIAFAVVLLTPGIFGFLVWELRGNWRLYESNRHRSLVPVAIGPHGETMVRLLKPGLHSGTIPKLYGKLRRATRQSDPARRRQAQAKIREKLHHVEEGLHRFFQREFLPLFRNSAAWQGIDVALGRIELGTNSVRVELLRRDVAPAAPVWLTFAEQSGWVIAGEIEIGWLAELPESARDTLRAALVGLYEMSSVHLVREQIRACFAPRVPPYDIAEQGIVVWPGERYAVEGLYDLNARPKIVPRPQAVADGFSLPVIDAERLIFALSSTSWEEWVAFWSHPDSGRLASVSHTNVLRDDFRDSAKEPRQPGSDRMEC